MTKFTEINTFRVRKTTLSSTFVIKKLGFVGTFVNRALLSLKVESHKITLTVPLAISNPGLTATADGKDNMVNRMLFTTA